MKRFVTLLLCVALLATMVACNGTEPEETSGDGATTTTPAETTTAEETTTATTPSEEETTTEAVKNYDCEYPAVSASERYVERTFQTVSDEVANRVKADGRSYVTDRGLSIDWSAAALEFCADCEGDVKLTLYTAVSITAKFKVFVDGEFVKEVSSPYGSREVVAAEGLSRGEHTVRLLRITDVEDGNPPVGIATDLTKITLTGVLMPRPADKDYYIEFLGDSVSCGVGAMSATDGYGYADMAFPYQTAQELDVDYSVVSVSGIGTMKSTSRHGTSSIYGVSNYFNYYRKDRVKFTPTRQADVVVIGTNANDGGVNEYDFQQHVKALIERMQSFHGEDTKFIWVFNMYTDRAALNQCVKSVFASLGGEAAGFYTVDFFVNKEGGDVHPSGEAHDQYTEILVEFIQDKQILG